MSGQVMYLSAFIYMPEIITTTQSSDPLMEKLLKEKRTARDFQERRHEDWNDNYELYRNKVRTNRLTQRQAVNIPLMKETVKTLLSSIDEPPNVDWKERGGDQMKELIYQSMWDNDFERLNFEGIDIQDKKTVLLYGRGFKKLNWGEDGLEVTPLDIYDVVIDPLTNPVDIETARFIIHQNIFRNLREILADDRYTTKGKNKLKIWLNSEDGMIQTARNKEEYKKKQERLLAMGVNDDEFALFAGGDVMVNITEHYTKIWDTKKKKFVKHVVVYADDQVELMNEKLEDLVGVNFYPFVTWGEDIESNDFWSDGPADLVRTPNKVVNVWFSQLVENRTLRNFQMHWYDATQQNYTPQTYEPGAGRMLPAPGNPRETIMPVEISGLDETLNSIDFLTRIIERGTAATATTKGVSEKKQITLGEVEQLVGGAAERTLSMAKFYRRSWRELAEKWDAMMHANQTKKINLTRTGRSGKMYDKVFYRSDWASEKGYDATVSSSSEQETEKTKAVQRFQFILQMFPNNPALIKIAQKRTLELVDLTPEEMREVEEAQTEQERLLSQAQSQQQQQAQPQQQTQADASQQANPQLEQSIQQSLQQLQNG